MWYDVQPSSYATSLKIVLGLLAMKSNWKPIEFLNQAHAWFLIIVSVQMFVCVCVCVFVHPPPRLLITSGMMWHDMDPTLLVKKFYNCYMATVVIVINGCGLGNGMCRRQ